MASRGFWLKCQLCDGYEGRKSHRSCPAQPTISGFLAQLVERRLDKAEVAGSYPAGSTTRSMSR